jgi:hypothetical protein
MAGGRLDRLNRGVPRAAYEVRLEDQDGDMPGSVAALVMIFGIAVSAGLVWAAQCGLG